VQKGADPVFADLLDGRCFALGLDLQDPHALEQGYHVLQQVFGPYDLDLGHSCYHGAILAVEALRTPEQPRVAPVLIVADVAGCGSSAVYCSLFTISGENA
jgi:hypothetical protein